MAGVERSGEERMASYVQKLEYGGSGLTGWLAGCVDGIGGFPLILGTPATLHPYSSARLVFLSRCSF